MIRVKLVLKYDDEYMPAIIYKACLQEVIEESRIGMRVKTLNNKLLLLLRGNKPSKVAEKLRNILGLINMAEQVALLLEAV
ncbi:MAG: hypothetical protein QXT26_00170 [Thermoproteota archaeon]